MIKYLRICFFIIVRIFVLIFLGLNIRRKEQLPKVGPAVIVANHNSHLDTLVLISLFPLKLIPKVRPVAAADYFLKNKYYAWFSKNIIGIIPINRQSADKTIDPLTPCYEALDEGCILVLFPEGSRGEPEKIAQFKKGISWLAERYQHIAFTPVFIYGLGKALPKDDIVLVPFFCDIFLGDVLFFDSNKENFMSSLEKEFTNLSSQKNFHCWD